MNNQRNLNVELLYVVLMTKIGIWHFIMSGLNMKALSLYEMNRDNSLYIFFSLIFTCRLFYLYVRILET